MRRLLAILTTCVAMLFLAGCAATATPRAVEADIPGDKASLNGTWQGILKNATDPDGFNGELAVRLTLGNADVKVEYRKKNGVWKEMMPGKFRISVQGSNATIQGTHFGQSGKTIWVETWVLGATNQSDESLRVGFLRVVNNVTTSSDKDSKAFAFGLAGTLERVTAAPASDNNDSSIVEITAEASGNFNWRGKSMTASELATALVAEQRLHPITEVRLLEGNTYIVGKQFIPFASAVAELGLKEAYFERDEEFEKIKMP